MKHEAGKALDELIAQKVLGWRWVVNQKEMDGWAINKSNGVVGIVGAGETWDGRWVSPGTPPFSTDVDAAWCLVERFTDVVIEKAGANYEVTINGFATAVAATAPLAICLAALEATE